MMRFLAPGLTCLLLLNLALTGCRKEQVQLRGQTNAASAVPQLHLAHAQPRLQTIKVWVGPEELITELALRPVEVATGMMFRTNMNDGEAMLFAFAGPHRASFYMRNTQVKLSAAYIDADGVIREIHDLHPFEEKPVEASTDEIQYVLEVPQGWFTRTHISTGAVLRTPFGTLAQTFRVQR